MGKFSAARSVWMPYSASAGTAFSPSGIAFEAGAGHGRVRFRVGGDENVAE